MSKKLYKIRLQASLISKFPRSDTLRSPLKRARGRRGGEERAASWLSGG